MGFLTRRSRLELLALAALLATITASAIVATGVLHDGPAKTASRLTALCAPIGTAITHDDPREVTTRDLLRLRQEVAAAARGLGAVIKDAERDRRGTLRGIRNSFELASSTERFVTTENRARLLRAAEDNASTLGARCPAPITGLEAKVVDRTLGTTPR